MALAFTAVNYYDGQGFLVPAAAAAAHVGDLDGASVCVQAGTDTQAGLQDYFSRNKLKFEPVTFENLEQMKDAFASGRCDAMTSDSTQLIAIRSTMQRPGSTGCCPRS